MIEQRLAHYRVRDRHGEGGTGEVCLAEDDRLGRQVAIKILPEELSEDTERKCQARCKCGKSVASVQ